MQVHDQFPLSHIPRLLYDSGLVTTSTLSTLNRPCWFLCHCSLGLITKMGGLLSLGRKQAEAGYRFDYSGKLYECHHRYTASTSMQDTWGENTQKPHFYPSSHFYEQEISLKKSQVFTAVEQKSHTRAFKSHSNGNLEVLGHLLLLVICLCLKHIHHT